MRAPTAPIMMNTKISTLFARFRALLSAPVDVASLVVFRVAFGVILLWEIVEYFWHGWIAEYWIRPPFHFTYPGFDWVHPWPGDGMYVHMAVLGVLAVFIAAGFFYRASATLFFLGFTYTFLLERARYLNHFYFVCLVSLLMIFVPAHRAFSVDAWRRPKLRAHTVAFWPLWLLRVQLGIVYFYSGVAKVNPDWFRGEPLCTWLHRLNTAPLVGPLFDSPLTACLISWAGLAFDLLIVPLLLWRRTRPIAFLAALFFHLTNSWFFTIGIFPWFSIAMTTLFFAPDWPRRLWARMRGWLGARTTQSSSEDVATLASASGLQPRAAGWTVLLISAYVAWQVLFPLRHWLYPGDVTWTEEGHEFSWRMKLRGKLGQTVFMVRNPEAREFWYETADGFLTPWQVKKMQTRPDLIRQFAQHLAAMTTREIGAPVKVRVQAMVALNGHEPGLLIDPGMDLSEEPYRLSGSRWITREPVMMTRPMAERMGRVEDSVVSE